ncbi:MAG: class III poly(R)-hydroxyalkanoic acid synthase subunit PhaE [Rudaea sp.]|uniref:class III poly(R)-hydroxyalkanoic acid synthase subunit PhaE n=1 Tax=Rudaea sp. TaxID=2136325 RepID=UPI0039E418AC
MSENKSMNDWMKDWDALQRQYFNVWSDLAQKVPFAMPPAGSPPFAGVNPFAAAANPFAQASPAQGFGFPGFPPVNPFMAAGQNSQPPWQEGMEQWSRLFVDAGKQSETTERLTESAKAYMAMMQSLFGAASSGTATENPAQGWFEATRGAFGANVPGFDPAAHPFAKALREVVGKGAQGFAELPAAFAPYVEQMRKEGMSWLSMPAFGLAREHQEHYQSTALALVEYQRALREYNRLMLKSAQRGNELFERKLAERSEPGRAIDSLKALYDLWVDAMEDAYAEIALSEEFSKAYGELANAQMRVRKQIQIEVERVSRELGMPTRTEVDSLSKRVHDLRREVRDGGVERNDGVVEAKVAALRDEVAALKKSFVQANAKVKAAPATAKVAEPAEVIRKPVAQKPRRAAAKSRAPAAVVRPRPVVADQGKPQVRSFADAVAAMRRRVVGKPPRRAAAAQMAQPSKGGKPQKKSGKKK